VNYVGIDLHKKTIVLCVLDQERRVVARRTFACCDTQNILEFFRGLGTFQAVVEATASYEWLVELIEPLADQVVLANPSKVYEIAHSKKKTDRHDAQVLAEARAKLRTVPGVGPVTIDVVVSELGDVGRFHSAKAVCAYAGLVPGVRQSSDKRKDLPITKAGSPLLRWALVEAAWRAVRQGAAWRRVYQDIKKRAGGKKAIVAVARRLLCVLYAMLRDGTNYNFLKVGEPQPA
jgi:transposase